MNTDKPDVSEDLVSSPDSLRTLYEKGKPHDVDGFYGISVRVAPLVLDAMRTDPSLLDFKVLDARFDKALLRFNPSDPKEVEKLAKYFPEASVILVTRGRVEKIMSMSTYECTVSATSDDGGPAGC